VEALAREATITAIPITTHNLPPDGSYFTFERNLADDILKGLK